MKTFPQAIQELEIQLSHSEEIDKIPLLKELGKLYAADYQPQKTLDCGYALLKIAENQADKKCIMEAYLTIGNSLQHQKKYEEAEAYLQKVAQLNESVKYKDIQLHWHLGMMKLLMQHRDFDAVPYHIEKARNLSEENDPLSLSATYFVLGYMEIVKGEYEAGLKYYFKSLQILKNVVNPNLLQLKVKGTTLLGIVTSYINQAVYFNRNLTEQNKAIPYLQQVLTLAEKIQSKPLSMGAFIQMGIILKYNQKYEQAIDNYQKALKIADEIFDGQHRLICKVNLANIYADQGNAALALQYYHEALEVATNMNLQRVMMVCNKNIGHEYYSHKQYELAIQYIQAAIEISEEIQHAERVELYKLMAIIHKEQNNADLVFEYMEKHIRLSKELFTEEKEKSIVEMQTRYETEQKEQEAIRLRELEQVKSRFFSQITHEFRTPLTLILGPLEQILNSKKSIGKHELNNRLSLVIRNGRRLSSLVNQLLDLSKLESGKMSLQKKHGDVIAFIQLLVEAFQIFAEEQQIQLHFSTKTTELNGYFDPDKLEKILYNLLSNAFKFTPSNGTINIAVSQQSISTAQSLLQIRLQDTGKGISSEQLPHIFDRFYQADNSPIRQAEGSGIGLSLVKELLELQKGTIKVESELEIGTTFYLELPLELSANAPVEKLHKTSLQFSTHIVTNQATQASNTKTRNSKKRKNLILVVEDTPDMQTYIHSILSPHHKVISADNGEVGVAKALEEVPDLIISDVMMPKKDGYALCKELKTDERTNHIPIILLTAKAALSSRLEGLQQGADIYLSKPFSPEELLLHISNHIQIRQQLQERYSKVIQLSNSNKDASLENNFLNKLIETIEAHLDDFQLGVEQLSIYMHMSRQQVYRKLHALTNYGPSEFIRIIRLKKAMTLLENKTGTISEIAYEVGFSSPGYFSKCFVKQYGVSPSKWKS
ncbi:MAG: ATP-binding protein [Chitinophagales bacterium]